MGSCALSGDCVYWKLYRSGLDFAIDNSLDNNPMGAMLCLDADYEYGCRVGFAWGDAISGDYLYYDTDMSARMVDPDPDMQGTRSPAYDIGGNPNRIELVLATSKYKLTYQQLEAGLEKQMESDVASSAIAGSFCIRCIDIKEEVDTLYSDMEDLESANFMEIFERISGWGGGIGCGSALLFFYGPITLFGSCKTALLCTDFKVEHTTELFEAGNLVDDIHYFTDCYRFILQYDFVAGLNIDLSTCSFLKGAIGCGVELHNLCCMPDFLHLTENAGTGNDSPSLFAKANANLGFLGCYARLTCVY